LSNNYFVREQISHHDIFMRRCLELAATAGGLVAPNPLVGAVLVCDGRIVGEGWHKSYGAPHAEPEAITSLINTDLLPRCTLYVNLEPCNHYGKTPPCTEQIIAAQIPRVVVACTDPFPEVNGTGIERLRKAGIEVETGILQAEARALNKFFFTYHEKKRPYIILKWAESADGFIDADRDENSPPTRISNELTRIIAHRWRSQIQAIMVGTNTVIRDNPQLTLRGVEGRNPLRLTLDRKARLDPNRKIFDAQAETIIFVGHGQSKIYGERTECVEVCFDENLEESILQTLYKRRIQSLMIEGGTKLIESFISKGFWDEARVFKSRILLTAGVKAPQVEGLRKSEENIGDNKLIIYKNPKTENELLNEKN
jgi:diaminohydroxyphosphoribosylaminopyrimidine deaminase/5-amino-6-(5-phosphoribosylamino)uracil reductase